MSGTVDSFVDHLFRHEAGRITAALTRALGTQYLTLAEEATQEALIKALQLWPFRGVPPEPAGWLYMTARNYARDQLRRQSSWRNKESKIQQFLEQQIVSGAPASMDDTLAMMLLCCHPEIPEDGRLALTLKVVSGFSTREIAAAFLTSEETVAQRIVRAKRRIRDGGLTIEMPEGEALSERLGQVCQILYLMFNEGYFASSGATVLRRDLCDEALRLLDAVLAADPTPARWALKALFHLHIARFDARFDDSGELLEFDRFDVARYDRDQIHLADLALLKAMKTGELTAWHIEASIACAHCGPSRDWPHIANLYAALLELKPGPLVSLNFAVALFRAGRRSQALAMLEELEKEKDLRGYSLLHATQARLHEEAGNHETAKLAYRRALACVMNAPARQFLERRLNNMVG